MRSRSMHGWLLAIALAAGCAGDPPPAAAPGDVAPPVDDYSALVGSASVSGVVKGPKPFTDTREVLRKLAAYSEEILPGLTVTTVDPAFKPVAGAATTKTDAQGRFTLTAPLKAGFVLATAASSSAPLVGLYRDGESLTLTPAGTLVASKIGQDLRTVKGAPSIMSLDRNKIEALTALVTKEMNNQALSPDYSLPSWIYGLDLYTYRYQGKLAEAFNALIPGSVAPKMSR